MMDDSNNGKLLFDKADFKANKQARISTETKRILQKKPKERTNDEVHTVQVALRNYESISEYPIHMQKAIASRAWYETFGPKRCITREGHIPMCFYFILSGSAIVTALDKDRQVQKTVTLLNRGDSFGEIGIINKSRRQTTVITKEPIQMFVLTDKDFIDIFMSGGLQNKNDLFLRSIDCLKTWPLHLLANHPKKSLFSFFTRNSVLVKDTQNSDWLYIVKSGSVSVMKKLKHVLPNPQLRLQVLELSSTSIPTELDHKKKIQNIFDKQQAELNARNKYRDRQFTLPPINIPTTKEYKQLKDEYENKTDNQGPDNIHETPNDELASSSDHAMSHKKNKRVTIAVPPPQNKKIAAAHGNLRKFSTKYKTEGEVQYVIVQTLTKGSVFGLEELIFGKQPSFVLVSNGAECILINKKFYMDNVSQACMVSLREQVYPYPTNEELQQSLEKKIKWTAFKKQTMLDAVRFAKLAKT